MLHTTPGRRWWHVMIGTYASWLPGDAVKIPMEERQRLARTIARLLRDAGYPVLVVSVSACHVHILAELPADLADFRKLLGWVKVKSSRSLKDVLPGRVWSRGDKHVLVKDGAHLEEEFDYVRNRQGPSAQSWSEGEPLE